MDILAARKKAAERAEAKKNTEAAKAAEAPAAPDEMTPPAPAAAPPAPEAPPPPSSAVEPSAAVKPAGEPEAAPPETPSEEIEMLAFRLSGEEYAVFVEDVREVLKIRELTRVPNAPAYILGVTSLRGTMLPVIDLCTRIGLTPVERDEKARILVVTVDDEDVGLLVDRVRGVVRVLPEEIKPAPEHVDEGAEFLRGIVRQGDRLSIVLDLHKTVTA